jgi:hypothetical protein
LKIPVVKAGSSGTYSDIVRLLQFEHVSLYKTYSRWTSCRSQYKSVSLEPIQGGAEKLAEFLTLKLNIFTASKIYEIWRLFSNFSLVFEKKIFFEKFLVF